MAVANPDSGESILSTISSAIAEGGNMGLLDSNGGVVEGLLLGALVGGNGGGLFGNRNNGNYGNNGYDDRRLDAADVQNIVSSNGIQTQVNALKGEIWQAEGQVQLAVAGTTNATLQGQSVITKAIADAATNGQIQNLQGQIALMTQIDNVGDATHVAVVDSARASAAQSALTDTLVAQTKFDVVVAINNDGEKTRAAIAALQASLPNARELDLQRQLAVAEADLRHDRTNAAIRSGNVDVVTTVTNTATAQQQQQQIWNINAQLADVLANQKITQGIINVGGTLTSGTQSAANTRL